MIKKVNILLADSVSFELIGSALGKDVESGLAEALAGGVVFLNEATPLSIFRQALTDSIRDIELHPKGKLFQEFLSKGPYEREGDIPTDLIGKRISDDETASAITFIYSHMVNCFKGAITELLASAACLRLMKTLQLRNSLPTNAQLYFGNTIGVRRLSARGRLKGADLYIIIEEHESEKKQGVIVAGVAEVKSYFQSESRLHRQIDRHIKRSQQGLWIDGRDYSADRVSVGIGQEQQVIRIMVLPDNWTLPRSFHFEVSGDQQELRVDHGKPISEKDEIIELGNNEWRINLRWSKEALDEAAYMMTFWYMAKVGEVVFPRGRPEGWEKMSPAEAGRNAAKMMLYYAIIRSRNEKEDQRAIALYNTYGFGYSLGMNFRNKEGSREMLWFKDLDEILANGVTKQGCGIR